MGVDPGGMGDISPPPPIFGVEGCIIPPPPIFQAGADPGFKKGGGTTHWGVFSDRRAASLESRASPKKADERGGTPTLFFRSATASRVAQVPKRGGGGGNPTHYCVPTLFFKGFKRGGHMYKKGGGKCNKKVSKRGARAGCAPPPKSATDFKVECHIISIKYKYQQKL